MEQQLVLQVNVDVVFALNFLVDVAWLLTAGVLAGVRPRLWRVALGAAAGSAAAVWVWFPTGRWLTSVPGLVVGTVVVLGVTFWPCRLRQALRVVGAALFGGAVMAGSYMLVGLRDHQPSSGASFSGALGGIGMLLCMGGGRYVWDALTTRARLARGAYSLRIRLGERSIETTALLDTGNSLRDPLSRLPVIVAEASVLANLLPEGVLAAVQAGWDGLDQLPAGWLSRCRLIPFRSVGQGGMLLAFIPDEIWVRAPATARWVPVRAMVGIAGEPLHPGGAYRALLSAEVYQAGEGEPGITWKGETGC